MQSSISQNFRLFSAILAKVTHPCNATHAYLHMHGGTADETLLYATIIVIMMLVNEFVATYMYMRTYQACPIVNLWNLNKSNTLYNKRICHSYISFLKTYPTCDITHLNRLGLWLAQQHTKRPPFEPP